MMMTIMSLLFSMSLHAEGVVEMGNQFAGTVNSPIQSMITHPPHHPPPHTGTYYQWARGRDGWGYCYQWASNGTVLNGGNPVANYLCEQSNPSHYFWGQGRDGFGYCYHFTPQGYVLNGGMPAANYLCDQVAPSYYSWAQSKSGYTYCYQFTSNGFVLNGGNPVANYLCH